MPAATDTNTQLSQAGLNLVRILIASYFIAVSIRLIPGTDATPLAATVLPIDVATLIGRSTFFILGYLVMTGIWLRPAAMLLGTALFWSSFVLHFSPGTTAPVGDFWRDLVMVGALILTYANSSNRSLLRSAMIRWTPKARKVNTTSQVSPRRVEIDRAENVTRLRTNAFRHRPVPAETGNVVRIENMFRDDLEDILAS